mmetsp:Transcript_4816/g.12904  ORF Transcript_4816/g.12904 Transcript_4816/m.12904 type:complete len:392 (-) Transcript_4816:1667-2842(-)
MRASDEDKGRVLQRTEVHVADSCVSVAVGPADVVVAVKSDGRVYEADAIHASDSNAELYRIAAPALDRIRAVSARCSRTQCIAIGARGEAVHWRGVQSGVLREQLLPIASHNCGPASTTTPIFGKVEVGSVSDPAEIEVEPSTAKESAPFFVSAAVGDDHVALIDAKNTLFLRGDNSCAQVAALSSEPWSRSLPRRYITGAYASLPLFSQNAFSATTETKSSPQSLSSSDVAAEDADARTVRSVKHGLVHGGTVAAVGCGAAHTVLALKDARIISFGFNQWGSCGHHNFQHIVQVGEIEKIRLLLMDGADMPTHDSVRVAASGHHTLLAKSGAVYAFGANHCGQLGVGTLQPSCIPRCILRGFAAVVDLAAGPALSGAIVCDSECNDAQSQ